MSGPLLLAISSFLSRLLGVIRSNRFAAYFGAGAGTDAYFAAFQLTDLIYNLVLFGAVSAAFIPIFSGYLAKNDPKNAWAFTNNLLNFLLLVVTIAALTIFAFCPYLLQLMYPGFDAERLELAVKLTRIMILAPIFFGLSGLLSSIQNAFQTFLAYSLAPILYNLSIIGGIIFLSPRFGIFGAAYGVVIGAFLHLAIQVPVVFKKGFRYQPLFNLSRPDFKQALLLAIPRIFGLAVWQVNLLVEGFLASTIAMGSLTILRYAQDLQSFPIGIIGLSLAISSFGIFAKLAAQGKNQEFFDLLKSNLQKIIFLTVPASIGLFILRQDIINLILRYGKFSVERAELTGLTLGILCVSLPFLSLIPLLGRAFYSIQDTKTPVIVGTITIIINLVLGFLLKNYWGLIGLALAGVIGAAFNFWALFYKIKKYLARTLDFPAMIPGRFLLNILGAASVMGGVVYGWHFQAWPQIVKSFFDPNLSGVANFVLQLTGLIISSGVGIGVYLIFTWPLKENRLILRKVKLRK